MKTFERLESQVRSYCRSFPVIFETAEGAYLTDVEGRRYIDFFAGAGALNYGHNHPAMKQAIVEYLAKNGVVHSLDMATSAKKTFLERFESVILRPRGLDYRLQFTGPTGTNAVEAALKLARRIKLRSNVIAFTNSFHGLSAGSLAVTAGGSYRHEAYINRCDVAFMPFDGYFGETINTIEYIEKLIAENGSGVDLPAAVIVETIQAEGGVNVASRQWLRQLEALCREWDILLIVDDIQVGCGRTGTFFSFEQAGIQPDFVVLSKAISGFGLPMSLLLIKPELDQWQPGEHSGTFRGNNLAFLTACEALRFWETTQFSQAIEDKSRLLAERLRAIADGHPELPLSVRGTGLIYGLEMYDPLLAQATARHAFQDGLLIELSGSKRSVLKFLPPLVISDALLEEGLDRIGRSIELVLHRDYQAKSTSPTSTVAGN